MPELSVLIPARCEMFLKNTVEDLLAHMRGDTEVIVVLDGVPADPPLPEDPRLRVISHERSIGQRAATNEAARLSRAKYVLKCDAHCAVDEGFDVKLMEHCEKDWTVVPIMRNLHVFNWLCENGHTRYQGPSGPCKECGNPTHREIVWKAKTNPESTSYAFTPEPKFAYFRAFKKRPEGRGDLTETMSLQGSCWMMRRDRYWELDGCDESLGSWGSQGVEMACKSHLSGGTVICNHKTWYAHAFRTQGGDWGFPYPLSNEQQEHAKAQVRDLFFNDKWPKQVRPLSWLVKKFWPIVGEKGVILWTDQDLASITKAPTVQVVRPPSKGLVYYSDCRLDEKINQAVQRTLLSCCNGHTLVSVTLKPMDFGRNIVLPLERGRLTMFKQILAGLEALDTDIAFLCEHDCLYSKDHFEFTPPRKDAYYFNQHTWRVDAKTGQALFYYCKQVSGLCAYRDLLVEHYRKRVERVEREGYDHAMGYEPGCHTPPRGIDSYPAEVWWSERPNVDIRHRHNLTASRWNQSEFRDKRTCQGWHMSDWIPGWGVTKGTFPEFLAALN